jgi:hypothetical protein
MSLKNEGKEEREIMMHERRLKRIGLRDEDRK